MTLKQKKIQTKKLHADPTNPNVCPPEEMAKLKANIEETGFYYPVLVYPHPEIAEEYQILDGHHRVMVLKERGDEKVNCLVAEAMERQEARVLLASLNRLRGEDNPIKRAELLTELTQWYPPEQLEKFLPESQAMMADLFLLMQEYEAEAEKHRKNLAKDLDRDLPEIFNFVVSGKDVEPVRQALKHFQPKDSRDPSDGFLLLVQHAMSQSQKTETEAS